MTSEPGRATSEREFEYHADLGLLNRLNYALSGRVRRKMFDLFMRESRATPESRVGDLGVTANRGTDVHYFFETRYPWKENLTAVGREEAYWYPEKFPGMKYVNADLRSIPLPDGYFDAAICNAVVEHAGVREQQARLIHEVCRVSKWVMVTTPNAWFPVDPHTFVPFAHWLPEPYYRSVLRLLGQEAFADVEVLNPLRASELIALFPPSRKNRLVKVGVSLLPTNLVCISSAS
jgi:hypothetical protein